MFLLIEVKSLDETPIQCNCDDEKTGIIDENVLQSKDQLPVQGKFYYITFCKAWTED